MQIMLSTVENYRTTPKYSVRPHLCTFDFSYVSVFVKGMEDLDISRLQTVFSVQGPVTYSGGRRSH